MIDLTTKYLGLKLSNPIVASASPLCGSLDDIRRLEDHGIAAVVLPSLFEEQLNLNSESVDSDLSRGSEAFPEALTYLPDLTTYNMGPDRISRFDLQSKSLRPNSYNCQFERGHAARVGSVRERHGTGRRRRDRAEHIFTGYGTRPHGS